MTDAPRHGAAGRGVLRKTMLVDADGTVARLWEEVDPLDHADDVLQAIVAL